MRKFPAPVMELHLPLSLSRYLHSRKGSDQFDCTKLAHTWPIFRGYTILSRKRCVRRSLDSSWISSLSFLYSFFHYDFKEHKWSRGGLTIARWTGGGIKDERRQVWKLVGGDDSIAGQITNPSNRLTAESLNKLPPIRPNQRHAGRK